MKSELKRKLVSLSITIIITILALIKNEINFETINIINNNSLTLETKREYNLDEDVENFMNENDKTFELFSIVFGISKENIKQEIIKNNTTNIFNKDNIFNQEESISLEKDLINYLTKLQKENKELFKREKNNGNNFSKEYVYSLINYFANIYGTDFSLLASIAYIESGNLSSKFMMSYNNVYGGMSNKGLIYHDNIEYGIFRFVSLVSDKYIAKGLTTPELIGKRYAPDSTTWASKVNSVKKKFIDYETKTIDTIFELREE